MAPDGQTGDPENQPRPAKVTAAKGQIVVEDRYVIHPDRPAPEHATSGPRP